MKNRNNILSHIQRHNSLVNAHVAMCIGMVLICLFFPVVLPAQNTSSVVFSVSRTQVTASNEELVDLVVKVVNTSAKPLSGMVAANTVQGLEIISKTESPVQLQAGDSTFVPVKIFVDKKAPSGRFLPVNFVLRDNNNVVLAEIRTQIRVTVSRNVSLFSMVANILLDNTMDSVIIPVRVSNSGNTPQKITVVSAYPASVQDGAFHDSKLIILQPSSDTMIYFPKALNRKMANSEGFNVTITGLYDNGDLVGMSYVRIQSARSNRNYRYLSGDDFTQNSITVASQSMFSEMQSYMLRGNGGIDFKKSRLGYNADLTTWNRGYASAMLRNTWVEYQSVKGGIHVGNINRNLDINLAGRGGSVFLNDTAANNRYEAGFMDGNTNLLGNDHYFPAGYSGWGMFSHRSKDWDLNSFAVYESNPSLNAKNAILGNTFNFIAKNKLRYSITLNAGHTTEHANDSIGKFGMAAGAMVTGTLGNLSINSSNYFSTGYYPGIQRGAIVLSERLIWIKERSSVWVNFDYNRYVPQTLSANQFVLPAFGMLRAEAGVSGKIGKVNISGAPRFTSEKNNAYQFPGASPDGSHKMDAWDIVNTINYAVGENHYFSVNTELGVYTTSIDPKSRFHLRSNAYYRVGPFNLNATAQLGTFFLGEAANNFASKTPSTYTINIIPSFQKSFLRNKLRTEVSVALMMSGYYGNNWFITGRGEYDITSKTSFYSMVNYNRLVDYSASILEMGITQKLQLPKQSIKTQTLELFVYRDINRNNVYDASIDSIANGYMLYINNDIFTTSADGSIQYKKLPDGNYRLSMPVSRGWYAPDQTVALTRKTRIEIPLQKTGILKGTMSLLSDAFSMETSGQVSGITLIATDSSNHTYTTKTTFEGNFVFYIPVGEYTISVDKGSLASELETINDYQRVKVLTEGSKVISFKIKVKSKKIETKKFTSPGVPKENRK